jgi:hypothetical protein
MKIIIILISITLSTGCIRAFLPMTSTCDKFSLLDKREVIVEKGFLRGVKGHVTSIVPAKERVILYNDNLGYMNGPCVDINYIEDKK